MTTSSPGKTGSMAATINHNSEIINSAQRLLVSNNSQSQAANFNSWFQNQLQNSQQNNAANTSTEVKEENDSDLEEINLDNESDLDRLQQMKVKLISVSKLTRCRHGRCAAIRLWNRFYEKPYFWISCKIFPYYPWIHFYIHFWNQNSWKKFLDAKKISFSKPDFHIAK